MPTYEYFCQDCDDSFEVFQSMSAPEVKECPKCNGSNIRKKIFAVNSIFKGDGFYTTEYRSDDYKKSEKQETSAPTASSSSSSEKPSKDSFKKESAPAKSGSNSAAA